LAGRSAPVAEAVEAAADEGVDGAGVEEGYAAHGGAAGFDQVAVGDGLEDVAGGARSECFEEVLLVVVHGEHEDAQVRLPAGEFAAA
jgi:hypothetical protein